ncbi:Methylated-DNA--protein-cysteine methyltransferase, constitutive [Limihaloglobus sulfuriphilus]|uniref:Methylated-DNA--protein-cysteine methyltransferase, constitutive n=1 Tax=Limihaloglobus sulfuriphilus TaxID=1851148 RepID=A0A1Q2MFB3_9BACT|nr:MGMT family protein [Limihaloglobus sulfuriphilus]AQQ71360.1 Methylated-DNA--protein-cysteine methyltransferase, constitutive [Limihaloglobus sulfuriphilus]
MDQQYCVFETGWGTTGFAAFERRLTHLWLPGSIGDDMPANGFRKNQRLMPELRKRIVGYFDRGVMDGFCDVDILLDKSDFARRVLLECRKLRPGETISYSALGARAGSPKAARAVGSIMANNPLPLIIPCHRVINAAGTAGGFMGSTVDTTGLKRRMLELERKIVTFTTGRPRK